MPHRIPFRRLDCVFLDAGNTLVGIDFARVADEARTVGLECDDAELVRAEAAVRPLLSQRVDERRTSEAGDVFTGHVAALLARTRAGAALDAAGRAAAARALVARLRVPGRSDLLWNRVLPGVPEALDRLRESGLRLYVVSNSDGTVAANLARVGLATRLDGIVDSHQVGAEKPDPRIFAAALREAGAAPEAVLHVGDLYSADVLGARRSGLHALLLDPFGDWPEVDCPRLADVAELAERAAAERRGEGGGRDLP